MKNYKYLLVETGHLEAISTSQALKKMEAQLDMVTCSSAVNFLENEISPEDVLKYPELLKDFKDFLEVILIDIKYGHFKINNDYVDKVGILSMAEKYLGKKHFIVPYKKHPYENSDERFMIVNKDYQMVVLGHFNKVDVLEEYNKLEL